MITLILLDNGEKNVIDMTYQDLWKEVKNIPDAKIIVTKDWFKAIPEVTTKLVCLIEPDCLVSSGYFDSLVGHIKKNPLMGHLGILSSATAVKNWAVKFYGYNLGSEYSKKVIPNLTRKSTKQPFYTVQIAYIPGAVIRTKFLREVITDLKPNDTWSKDLVFMSTELSLAFWRKKWMVYNAPNSTYCTTEDYVNDIASFDLEDQPMIEKFQRESI